MQQNVIKLDWDIVHLEINKIDVKFQWDLVF